MGVDTGDWLRGQIGEVHVLCAGGRVGHCAKRLLVHSLVMGDAQEHAQQQLSLDCCAAFRRLLERMQGNVANVLHVGEGPLGGGGEGPGVKVWV